MSICDMCGVECGFNPGWNEADAEKEYNEKFQGVECKRSIVCDDCYIELITPKAYGEERPEDLQ